MGAVTIAVQLYTLRSLPGGFSAMLDVVASAGVTAVETVGRHGWDADEMRDALAKHGLRAVSSHVALDALERDPIGEAAFARAVGIDTLVVPWIAPAGRPSDAAGWAELGERLARLAGRLRDRGVRLAYHHHDFELVDVAGRHGLARLADAAGSDLDLEVDVGWITRAGLDPVKELNDLVGRVRLLHAKDVLPKGTAPEEDDWAAAGSGTIDWSEVLPAGRRAGVNVWIVEHDRPRDPAGTVAAACRYLASQAD